MVDGRLPRIAQVHVHRMHESVVEKADVVFRNAGSETTKSLCTTEKRLGE